MAKTLSPLFSSSAHGKLARSLVYSKKQSGQLARAMHYPKKEPSLKQWTRRHIVGLLTAHWQCMTDDERSTWNTNAAASYLNLPGYQYFLKLAQADLYTHHGLVTYWSCNESSGDTLFDYSGNSINGLLSPSYPDDCPIRVSSFKKEYGNALFFDGINDFAKVNHYDKLNFSSQFSFEFWLKLTSLSGGWQVLFSRYLQGPGEKCYMIEVYNFLLQLYLSANGTDFIKITASTFLTLEWTHIVITLGLDDTVRIFFNSIQDASTGPLTSLNVFNQISHIGALDSVAFIGGVLDEIRFYNRALSGEEIKKHYQLLRLDKKRQPLLRL